MNTRTRLIVFAAVVACLVFASSFQAQTGVGSALPVGQPVTIKAPLGLRAVPIPADNPPTKESIALGRRLYYDPQLSADGTISCASCHAPQFAFGDSHQFSLGR
ncbi:MAG TPA: cytochrome c peroxidase [Terriglobales bacterium]|nr:cytochrome c peroxidase [Terriglobales bacterium]